MTSMSDHCGELEDENRLSKAISQQGEKYGLEKVVSPLLHSSVTKTVEELEARIKILKSENKDFEDENKHLLVENMYLQTRIDSLESEIITLKAMKNNC
jgi:uncharacterized small protein (DUF1192 family)